MANPFEEFGTSPSAQTNPFAEFGGPATANPFAEFGGKDEGPDYPGMIPGNKPRPPKHEDKSDITDKAKGVAEAALSLATGLPAMLAGAVGGLVGGEGPQGKDKLAGEIAQKYTYAPRSEKGQEYAEEAGDFINRNLNPLLGLGHLAVPEAGRVDAGIKGKGPTDVVGDLGKPGERIEPTLNPEPTTPAEPTGPTSPAPQLQPSQAQGDLFTRGYTPGGEARTQPDLFGGPDITFPDEAPAAIRPELRWLHEKALDESRQQIADAFAKSHDEFIQKQLQEADTQATGQDRIAAEQADVQRRTAELQNQDLADKLERTDNAASAAEIRKAMQANDDLIAKLKEADANRGQNPIYVDPQAQAFRGDPTTSDPRLALDRQTTAMNTELEHLRGQGTPEGTPLRPLTDVTRTPTEPLENYTPNASRAYDLEPAAPPKGFERPSVPEEPTAPTAPVKSGIRVKGKKQSGGVTTDLLTLGLLPKKNPIKQILKKSKDGTFIPEDMTPEELSKGLETARAEKDGNSARLMDSGAQLTAMKRGSTAIKMAGDLVETAFKRADLNIRKVVFPAEDAIRSLSTQDMISLGKVLKAEMFDGAQYSKGQLSLMTPKLQNAYRIMRDSLDQALKVQNEARALKGQKPVTAKEAYLSSRWQGDFRRPLYDAKGKLMWFLASDNKMSLDAQTRAVLKEHPDLTYDPKKDFVIRFWNRKADMESAYTTMLDILGRDDPAVGALKSYMEDLLTGRGASFLGQEKHFKNKSNVRGFVGDRPETTVNDYFDRTIPFGDKIRVGHGEKGEMLAMFQQQMNYMKNAMRWSEIQKATDSLKKIVNDPELVEHQPNNIKYIQDYYKHSIGYGESRATRAAADSLRDFGFSPEPFDRGVGGMKSFFILDKLAINVGYVLTQGIQLSMIIPHMVDLGVKGGFVSNPIKALSSGLLGGLTMGTGHVFNAMSGKARFEGIPGADFFNRAYKYAEDNGITARSIYDESPVKTSFSPVGQVGKALGKTISLPETYIRSMAFTTLAQFLKDSGKYADEADIFREAERRTNVAMVDYAQTERPMIFAKLGTLGNLLNTLQTYAWNYYNQFSYFTREAAKGNVLPFAAFLAMQYAISGVMGVPGMEDAYKAYMAIKEKLPATYWQKIQENDFLREPKLWVMKNYGTSFAYGILSDKLNVNMTSRLAAPSGNQMLSSPLGPPTEIAKQAYSAGRAMLDPTNTTKLSQAAMDLTPPGVQGLLETSPMMEGHTYNKRPDGMIEAMRPTKLEDRSGVVLRNDRDVLIRRFGLRSQNEVTQRDINYSVKRDEVAAQENSKDLVNKYYDAARRGDKKDATDYYKTYVYMTGKGISDEQVQSQIQQEFLTDSERAGVNAKQNLQALLAAKRIKEIHDAVAKENQK